MAVAAAAAEAANTPSQGMTGPPVSQSDTHRGPQNGTPDSNATDEVKTEDSPDGTRISQLVADNTIPGREMEPQPNRVRVSAVVLETSTTTLGPKTRTRSPTGC